MRQITRSLNGKIFKFTNGWFTNILVQVGYLALDLGLILRYF